MVESQNESETGRMGARRRRVRRDASQWRALIEQQRVSGQSIKAFCAEHGLGEASFYAWRRHLRQQAAQPDDVSHPSSKETRRQSTDDGRTRSTATGFVRLDPQADASSDAIEVQFTGGATLRCASSHLPDLVRLLTVDANEAGRC
jgi:hypothetical protein